MKKFKNEDGVITILTLITILFIISFLISSYIIVSNKVKTQKEMLAETRKIYESTQTMDEIYNLYFSNDSIIPIYTVEQFLKIGSNENVKIEQANNKYYTFSNTGKYVLMNGLEINENVLPENWIAPEFFFLKLQNKPGLIDYNGYIVRILYQDGTEKIFDGNPVMILDIADGGIELRANGYIQGEVQKGNRYNINGEFVEYTGKYIITGETEENFVKITQEGDYNITLKDLKIDVSQKDELCAFNANVNKKATGLYVNIILDGNNYIYSGKSAAGLGFSDATPNINGIENGSTLTLGGNGNLEVKGGSYSAAIGTGYTGFDAAAGSANNIIINSGNIKTLTNGTHGSGIGGGFGKVANNIIINGGNIEANGNGFSSAIGGDNITINGGNIKAYAPWGGAGIGLGTDTTKEGTNLKITGGNIYATGSTKNTKRFSAIGQGCESINIEGGTIISYSKNHAGLYDGGNVKITGGNLLLTGLGDIGTLDADKNFVQGIGSNGTNNLYLTQIKLQDLGEGKKIKSITTSDNIEYGIKDMYTLEEGMVYVYLPEGTRTIQVNIDETMYSAQVTTSAENANVVTTLFR